MAALSAIAVVVAAVVVVAVAAAYYDVVAVAAVFCVAYLGINPWSARVGRGLAAPRPGSKVEAMLPETRLASEARRYAL